MCSGAREVRYLHQDLRATALTLLQSVVGDSSSRNCRSSSRCRSSSSRRRRRRRSRGGGGRRRIPEAGPESGRSTQRLQYPLIEEYTSKYSRIPNIP